MIVHDLVLATRRSKLTGIERFAINVFVASRRRSENVVALVATGSPLAGSKNVIEVGSALRGWLHMSKHIRALSADASVVCAAFPASPSLWPTKIPIARVIHDAFAWTRPKDLTIQGRIMFAHYDRLMLKRYDHIYAPTEVAQQELISVLGQQNIGVCGNAPGLDVEAPEETPIPGLAPKTFSLAVGTIEPRKNYERLIALAKSGKLSGKIVVAGRAGWGDSAAKLASACAALPDQLIWHDDLDDKRLRWLYRNAHAFISLSHAEGFNMPLVEAGMSGCPVLCSDLPIHRAVAPPWACIVGSDADDNTFAKLLDDISEPNPEALALYRHRFDWARIAERIERPLEKISI